MHVNIADIGFFSKSAVNRKRCLLAVDFFTSKMYAYQIKSRHLLAQKVEPFYQDISQKGSKLQKEKV